MRKETVGWVAEQGMTHLSKPNGVVGVYEIDKDEIITVQAN